MTRCETIEDWWILSDVNIDHVRFPSEIVLFSQFDLQEHCFSSAGLIQYSRFAHRHNYDWLDASTISILYYATLQLCYWLTCEIMRLIENGCNCPCFLIQARSVSTGYETGINVCIVSWLKVLQGYTNSLNRSFLFNLALVNSSRTCI